MSEKGKPLALLTIGYRTYLLSPGKAQTVIAALAGAQQVESSYESGKLTYTLGDEVELKLELLGSSWKVQPKPKAAPMPAPAPISRTPAVRPASAPAVVDDSQFVHLREAVLRAAPPVVLPPAKTPARLNGVQKALPRQHTFLLEGGEQ